MARTTLDLFRTWVDPFAGTEVSTMADFAEETVSQPVVPVREGQPTTWRRPCWPGGTPTAKGYPERFRTRFLGSMRPTSSPTLHFMHLVLPHQPWRYYPGGTFQTSTPFRQESGYPFSKMNDQGDSGRDAERTATPPAGAVHRRADRSDAGSAAPHRPLRPERDQGVIVSDHGYSFESGTLVRNIEAATLDSLAYTPLLVKQPGQAKGAIDDSNVTALDVLPTIADAAGVVVPFEVAGLPAHDERVRDGISQGDRRHPPRFGEGAVQR